MCFVVRLDRSFVSAFYRILNKAETSDTLEIVREELTKCIDPLSNIIDDLHWIMHIFMTVVRRSY
jgi:hypothetical protein